MSASSTLMLRQAPTTRPYSASGAAGASAPEELVEEVLARLAPLHGVEEIFVTDEDEYFPPPRNIRDLQAAIDTAITAMTGACVMSTPGMDDRLLAASTVLEALSES
jgi:4-hydroxy-3-methylbut-2-enyl diphosphate reductase